MSKVEAGSVGAVEQKQRVIIGLDNTNEQILALDQDAGIEIEFDVVRFRKLSDDVVDKLKRESKRKYWVAEAKHQEMQAAPKGVVVIDNPLGNSSDAYSARLKVRERTGYHTYWAAPGADFERCMASGMYTQVREPTEDERKKGVKPGYESGEVKKIMTSEGKVELIALECPIEAYEQYLQWMSQQSSLRYGAIKADYYEKTEEINRGIGGRNARIIPGEVSEDGAFKAL